MKIRPTTDVRVCIPTIGESPLLGPLLATLLADPAVKAIDLYLNPDEADLAEVRARVLSQIPESAVQDSEDSETSETAEPSEAATAEITVNVVTPRTLYPSWNASLQAGRRERQLVAILNDDIGLPPTPITAALEAWLKSPRTSARGAICGFDCTGAMASNNVAIRKATGSFRHGGVPGFAFLADPTLVPDVDEQFQLWYGDDDLFFSTVDQGHRLAVCWVPVTHEPSTTLNTRDWADAAIAADTEAFAAKWGAR